MAMYQCSDDVDKYTKKFIQELVKPECVQANKITGKMTTQQHIQAWKQMKKQLLLVHLALVSQN